MDAKNIKNWRVVTYNADRREMSRDYKIIATGVDNANNVVNVYETKIAGRMRYFVGYVSDHSWKISGNKRDNPVTGLNVSEDSTTSFVAIDWDKEKILTFAKKYFNVEVKKVA